MKKSGAGKKTVDFISCKNNKELDISIKNALKNTGMRIEASENLKQRIDFQIAGRSLKEERRMKGMSIKKVVLGVAAACVMVGTAAAAGSGIVSYIGHGSAIPDYTKFEDMGKAEAEIGYSVDSVESFSNGFRLDGIYIREEELQDESGQTLGKRKGLHASYSKGREEINVYCSKLLPVESGNVLEKGEYDKTSEADDITMGYRNNTYKAVPPDYEPTEEDEKAMESGHLQIGYGSDRIEISQFSSVIWVKDGIQYEILGFDVSLSADEMFHMAQEIMESGN